ncbi:ribosome maturation factor RimM [Salinarimonas sp. NSM]|uniref:ribosome maturation factor RimM n=1 Tax=Salinarimonas sp. NSM TaxID=3458003 RepID=UPI0040356182
MPGRRQPERRGARARGPAEQPFAPPSPRAIPAAPAGDLVRVAELGRAHGVRGEIRLKSFTEDPTGVARLGPLTAPDGRRFTIESARRAPGGAPDLLVVRLAGVTDRTAAEALTRTPLHAPRAALAAPDPDEDADEDTWLAADLIGLAVLDAAGETIGRIVAVPDFGAGDLLEIAPANGGPTAYLPFTRAFVPEVAVAEGRVVVRPPADLFAPARGEPSPDDESQEDDSPRKESQGGGPP